MIVIKPLAKRNFRDLGGVINRDGLTVKKNAILRSGHLSKLTEKEIYVLKNEYSVNKILDLRSSSEKDKHPDTVTDCFEYTAIPYFNETSLEVTGGMGSDVIGAIRRSKSVEELIGYVPELENVYSLLARDEYSVSQISKAVRTVMDNRDGAVLFHCTAGKDRTGVTSAIIYKILNVDSDTVNADYLKTNEQSEKNSKRFSKLALIFFRNKQLANKVRKVYLADMSYLNAFFDTMNEIYGSFDNFVHDGLRLNDDDIENFKKYILI